LLNSFNKRPAEGFSASLLLFTFLPFEHCTFLALPLFHNAKILGKNAACLLTVSDNLATHEETTSEERQNAFTSMMKIALEMAE
jgi:hypothetical protein